MSRQTLAQQLAQIAEPTPVDFDPEDSYSTYAQERRSTAADLQPGRADYLDLTESKLRKKGEAVYDDKYLGKKGSRKDLYGVPEDEEESEGEEDDDEEMDDFEDLEGDGQTSAFPPSDEDDQDDEDEDIPSSVEEEQPPPPKVKKSSRGPTKSTKTTVEEDEKAMMKQMKQAASAEIEKGRDVKKQLAFCDNILESRIKIQKAATAVSSLPIPSNAGEYYSEVPEELAAALAEVEALNEELFSLREDLLRQESIDVPTTLGATRKRKRVAGGIPYMNASLGDLQTLESALEPYMRATITKWSDKVLSASGLALSSSKKFKAINQNTIHSIDHSLGPGERERLLKRTRTKRSFAPVLGATVEEGMGRGGLEGEEVEEKGDAECFDDGDFYQQILRDVVESRMLDLDDPTLASLRLASARGKKQKKIVDTGASKGRKIRYHVHEKVQNFMIPIEAGTYHEEQIDELFASLLGRTFAPEVDDEEEVGVGMRGNGGVGNAGGGKEREDVAVGSLRIFG